MMRLPPGEPMAMTSRPSRPSTRVGDIELRGRLSASTRLATGRPSARGAKEKSVSSLFSRSEEHTSELQSLMRISYAVFCLKKKKIITHKYSVYHNLL